MKKYDQKRQFVQSEKIPRGKVPKLRRLQFQTIYVSSNCLVSKSSPNSFANPRTAARQAPLSMGFPRKEYWSGLPFPSPGDFPNPGIKPVSPALASGFFTTEPPGKACYSMLSTSAPHTTLSILVCYYFIYFLPYYLSYTYNPTIQIVDIYNNLINSYLTYLELCYEAITCLENNQDAKESTPKDVNKNSKYISSKFTYYSSYVIDSKAL